MDRFSMGLRYKGPQTNLMTGDLFPVAMISFRSVASLMLEPLMNVCWRQIFAILFCLKRNNWRLSKASTSWFDILGYFTIFSSIQTHRTQLYTKNIQSNCSTEEGFDSFCGGGGDWYDLWLFLKAVGFKLSISFYKGSSKLFEMCLC